MRKKIFLLILSITVVTILAACGFVKREQEKFSGINSSSEKVEVFMPGESEPVEVLSGVEKVEKFFSELNFNDWVISSVSDGTEEAVIYKFYDREMVKLGEEINEQELFHSGTMIVYANEPKVTFKTKLFSVSLEVPAEDYEKLLQ